MKILTLVFNDGEQKINLPTSIQDLTWGQAMNLIDLDQGPEYTMQLVSIMTGIPADTWRQSTETRPFLQLAIECQAFVNVWAEELADVTDDPISPVIEYEGKKIHFPDDIGRLSIGQYQDVMTLRWKWGEKNEQTETPNIKDSFELFAKTFQIYLQPLIDGDDYSYPKALGLNINSCRYIDVVSWSYFFLNSLNELNPGTPLNQPADNTQPKNNRLDFRESQKNTDSGRRWIRSRLGIFRKKIKS